jgi:hypothetical protein
MNPVIAAVVLLLLVVAGSYASFRQLPLRYIYLFGTEFFLVGIALGSQTTGVLDRETLFSLEPVFELALAWIGMLYGLQFNVRRVASIRGGLWLSAFLTFATTGAALWGAVRYGLPLLGIPRVEPLAELVLALALTPAAMPFVSVLYREGDIGLRKELYHVRYVAALDDLFPLAGLVAVLTVMVSRSPGNGLSAAEAAGLSGASLLGASLVVALVFALLSRRLAKAEEKLLVVVGCTMLAAGLSSVLRVSPLLTGVFSGVLLANLTAQADRIATYLEQMEKPVYLLLLLLMGAYLTFDRPLYLAFLVPLLLFGVRVAVRLLSGQALASMGLLRGSGWTNGALLLPVGGMSAAMAGAFCQVSPEAGQDVALFALATLLVSDALSPVVARWVARRGGDA